MDTIADISSMGLKQEMPNVVYLGLDSEQVEKARLLAEIKKLPNCRLVDWNPNDSTNLQGGTCNLGMAFCAVKAHIPQSARNGENEAVVEKYLPEQYFIDVKTHGAWNKKFTKKPCMKFKHGSLMIPTDTSSYACTYFKYVPKIL